MSTIHQAPRTGTATHPAALAWLAVEPRSTVPDRVELVKEKQKSSTYRLPGVGSGGRDIIAKRCLRSTARIERLVYEEFLTRCPQPSLRLHGFLEESRNDECWLFIEDAGPLAYQRELALHRVLAGSWLAVLHASASDTGIRRGLPDREPAHYLRMLQASRAFLARQTTNPVLPRRDLRMLKALREDCDRLESRWDEIDAACQGAPRTLVHGDLASKNVRIRNTGGVLTFAAFDWENAGWGVPATDLAQRAGHVVSPSLHAYSRWAGRLWDGVDEATLGRVAHCGRVFRLLESIIWEGDIPFGRPYSYFSKTMSTYRVYQTRMHRWLEEAVWS